MNVVDKKGDTHTFCGLFSNVPGDGLIEVWMQPHINHGQQGKDAWICPAWFIELTNDTRKVNMQVTWEKKGVVWIPRAVNTVPLDIGDRLYRQIREGGELPQAIRGSKRRRKKQLKALIALASRGFTDNRGTAHGAGRNKMRNGTNLRI